MQAKNGELAIARFDPTDESERWEEHVCFVTGRDKSQTKFVYWEHKCGSTTMYSDSLPKGRVISAAPKPGNELLFLGGEFCKLTIDDVVPATQENMAALCLSIDIDTSNVKLGGCYHTGRAYCLGYRTTQELGSDGDGSEIELDTEIFTCLDSGLLGGARAALKKHREGFDSSKDIPRFIVELAAVRIIDEVIGGVECNGCGTRDVEDGQDKCLDCLPEEDCECGSHPDDCNCDGALDDVDDDYCDDCDKFECICDESFCCDCGEQQEECTCDDDDDDCIRCGLDPDTCGCWDEGGCMNTSDLDDENVNQTFRPMNAFARAHWLKACRR